MTTSINDFTIPSNPLASLMDVPAGTTRIVIAMQLRSTGDAFGQPTVNFTPQGISGTVTAQLIIDGVSSQQGATPLQDITIVAGIPAGKSAIALIEGSIEIVGDDPKLAIEAQLTNPGDGAFALDAIVSFS